ncbi:MAG: family 20 glycosylhydrolase, partial [Pseudomonadales bacterium]
YPGRQSLKLLDDLHGEYLPLFDSEYFNVGGDEPWELGLGRSRARCEQEGTTNVYIDFLSDIQRLTEHRGRRMMFWSDIVLKEPDSLKRLSKQLIALNWGYEGNHPFAKESELVAKQNIPFYVCPGTSSWNSLVGRTDNMRKNIQSAAKQGKQHGAEGLLVTDWGDHGHHQYLPISYPGFALAACESWHQGSVRPAMLPELVNRFFLKERDTSSAGQLIEHGRVLNLARSPLRNATIFNRLLFWQMRHEPGATKKLSEQQLNACLDAFADLASGPQPSDPLVAAELGNAREMASHGIQRLLYFRGSRGFSGAKGLKSLRQQIRLIQGEHERIWLERNRIGGLRESSGHLERSEQALLRTK